ncbi:MAG: hypothetical protein Q7K57_17100 [Burkholderiaceae bacterium]|nr:hypothetical protein [Burkholderiaceae bacterium]
MPGKVGICHKMNAINHIANNVMNTPAIAEFVSKKAMMKEPVCVQRGRSDKNGRRFVRL